MSVAELLSNLRKSGIELRLDGERLVCDAPKQAMTPEIMHLLKQKKAEILTFLQQVSHVTWSPLVPIRANGSDTPFFCFHGVGGNVLNYGNFLNYLDPSQPLYGLQSKGLDGKTMPFGAIESMAQYYLDAIRTVQTRGPYLLGGGSMGGLIAFEVAHKLLRSGERVGLLILFDTIGPNYKLSIGYRGGAWRKSFDKFMNVNLRDKLNLVLKKIQTRLEKKRKVNECLRMLEQNQTLPHDLRIWFIEYMNYQAIESYKAQPYDGEIILIKGDDKKEGIYSDPYRGWKGISDKLRIIEVPGQHSTLIEEPQLCREFAKCLRDAQVMI